MSRREEILNRILETKAIAVIRMADSTKLVYRFKAFWTFGAKN